MRGRGGGEYNILFGYHFFSWRKNEKVLASVSVDDFENFAILNVDCENAMELAKSCAKDQPDIDWFSKYKNQIDDLASGVGWIPICSIDEVEKG